MNNRARWLAHVEQPELGFAEGQERRLKRYPMARERAILYAVLDTLRLHPAVGKVWRQNTGAMLIGGRYVQFGIPGQPDITGWLKDGRRLDVEVKRKGEHPSDKQAAYLANACADNCVAFVARSSDDVIRNLGALAR